MEKKCAHAGVDHCCNCEGCGWGMNGGMRRHGPLRMLIVVLGALIIFWCGFKLGTINGFFMSEYSKMGQVYGPRMMNEGREKRPEPMMDTTEAPSEETTETTLPVAQ